MTLFASLHTRSALSLEETFGIALPGCCAAAEACRLRATTAGLDVTALRQTRPNFDRELLGFEPTIVLHFAFSRAPIGESRRELVTAVRNVLNATTDDVGVLYMNSVVLKRTSKISVCAADHVGMLPASLSSWAIVSFCKRGARSPRI